MKHTLAALLALAFASAAFADVLKINGSTTVNLPAAEAAEILRAEKGMQIQIDTQGGSSGGISNLGDGQVQIGMASKPLTEGDRAKYPKVNFRPIHIGEDAVALVVSRDVWESGVKALTREQARGIYEGQIKNWKDVGGEDRRIAFSTRSRAAGRGRCSRIGPTAIRKRRPLASFPEVGGNEETRNKVASTRGAMSQLSSSWADGKRVFALAVKGEDGKAIEPSPANIATRDYPMSRSLFLITNGEPAGEAKAFVDFMLSDRGQELLKKHGYLALAQLK